MSRITEQLSVRMPPLRTDERMFDSPSQPDAAQARHTAAGRARCAVTGAVHLLRSHRAMCSATIIVGRFVFAVGIVGMMEASATVSASIP